MRLPIQLSLGRAFIIAFPVGLSVLCISLLSDLEGGVTRAAARQSQTARAAGKLKAAMLRCELERRGRSAADCSEQRKEFLAHLASLREQEHGPEETMIVDRVERKAAAFFEGRLPAGSSALETVLEVDAAMAELEVKTVARDRERCNHGVQSGFGLVAIIGVLGLLAALYFGYWLTRRLGYPLEGLVRGVERVAAGDYHCRVQESSSIALLRRLSSGVNHLADTMQKTERERRLDFLLVSAALERLLDERGEPAGLLTPGQRLVAANGRARRLLQETGTTLHALAGERESEDPHSVERLPLEDPGGMSLGELIAIRSREAPPRRPTSRPAE